MNFDKGHLQFDPTEHVAKFDIMYCALNSSTVDIACVSLRSRLETDNEPLPSTTMYCVHSRSPKVDTTYHGFERQDAKLHTQLMVIKGGDVWVL